MRWIALLIACGARAPEPASPSMPELPPFEDPSIEPLYQRILTWADGLGWTPSPLARRGAALQRTWVRGEPGRGSVPAANTARLALSVFAATRPTSSYGLEWSGVIADDAGLGLRLYMVVGARGYTSDQARIDLLPGAEPAVELGAPLTWTVGERVLQTPRPSGAEAVWAKLAAYQGASFTASAEQDLRDLDLLVRPVLERGDYTVCDYGPSPGRGIPGPCLPRAPSEAEREAHRASFDAELARRRAVLGDGAGWAALLGQVAPPR